MRLCLILSLCVLVGPAAASVDLAHLLGRAGFQASLADVARFEGQPYEDVVDSLLAEVRREAVTSPPAWVNEKPADRKRFRDLSEQQRKAAKQQNRRRRAELKAWWFGEMLVTDSPLTERMVLFWHNHFTSSLKKVKSAQLMYRQNALLRRHALGNFRDLLHGIARDPAMIVYLDSVSNRKDRPNENFARELLELFTLGEGSYSEQDIKEVARAFTGWSLDRNSGGFRFRKRHHDDGEKLVFGQRGRFDGDDVIHMLLARPGVAEHVVGKFWREFVADAPDVVAIRHLARLWREADYEIRPLVRALLTSAAFRDAGNRSALIKSPVDLLVGTMRFFELDPPNKRVLALASRQLGQDLFDPPNVKGWPGGTAWIDSQTLLQRQQLAERLGGEGMSLVAKRARQSRGRLSLDAWVSAQQDNRLLRQRLVNLLAPAGSTDSESPADLKALVAELLLDPAYQLK